MGLYQARCARPDIARPASRRQIIMAHVAFAGVGGEISFEGCSDNVVALTPSRGLLFNCGTQKSLNFATMPEDPAFPCQIRRRRATSAPRPTCDNSHS
jgi:hypothetical protein